MAINKKEVVKDRTLFKIEIYVAIYFLQGTDTVSAPTLLTTGLQGHTECSH